MVLEAVKARRECEMIEEAVRAERRERECKDPTGEDIEG